MTGAHQNYVRTTFAVCCLVLFATLWPSGAASARAVPKRPDGLAWGPWIFRPWIAAGFETDDNVRRNAPEDAIRDEIGTLEAEVEGILVFRNSKLRVAYGADREDFDAIKVERNIDQDLEVDLTLNFSTGDRLRFFDRYNRSFSLQRSEDTGEGLPDDPGDIEGAETFVGEPFDFNRWEIRLTRAEPRRQGYDIKISRVDFNYRGTSEVSRYDYRGFDNSFEYRHPMPQNRWWTVFYNSRRINHYNDPNVPRGSVPVGMPYRKEVSDSLQLGLRGDLGEGQPFVLRLGYTEFEYEGQSDSRFTGISGQAQWTLALGADSDLTIGIFRRPLPSSFSTYYVNNIVRTGFESDLRRNLSVRAELGLTLNRYEDLGACRLEDSIYDGEVGATWQIQRRVGFDLSAAHNRRSSNCDTVDSRSTTLNATLKVGWF